QRIAERLGVPQLAGHDDTGGKRIARELLELGDTVVRDARGCKLRRADLQADELLRAVTALGAAAAAARGQLREREGWERDVALVQWRLRDDRQLARRQLDGGSFRLAAERELLLPERRALLLRRARGLFGL